MFFGLPQNLDHEYVIKEPPADNLLAVSLDEAKAWLKIECEDSEMDFLVRAAMTQVERYTGATLFETVFITKRDYLGQDWILRRGPIKSISSIKYLSRGVMVTVAATEYFLHRDGIYYGYAARRDGKTWPLSHEWQKDAVDIEFVAGFGTDSMAIPADIRLAILNQVADLHANRGDCGSGMMYSGLSQRVAEMLHGRRSVFLGGTQ